MQRLIERGRGFIWARRQVFIGAIVALMIVSLLIWLGYTRGWKTGFDAYTDPKGEFHPAKTLWDWMELLIIPIVLALGGFLFSRAERKAEREAADQRADAERKTADDRNQETALQNYLDKMTELLLQRNLAHSKASSEVWNIARARTVTTLRQLNSTRRNLLLRFLFQAGLISKDDPVQILLKADLSGADLSETYLIGVNLSEADLSEADLGKAYLINADLSGAVLSKANLGKASLIEAKLSGAYLIETDLSEAILGNADLSGAKLLKARLTGATLIGAKLIWAHLQGAHLIGANLFGADLTNALLDGARYNDATRWPDGFTPPPEAIKERGDYPP